MNINAREVFAKNLSFFLDKNGKTQADIVRDLNFKQPTVSDWVKGKKYPRVDKMQELADYLGVLMSDLTEEKPAPPEGDGSLSDEHKQIIERFKNLSAKNKLKMLGYMDSLAEQDNQ